MDIRQVVADNIRFIREKRGLSQVQLALKSGVSITHIGCVERAEQAITIVKLQLIAKVLRIEPGELLFENAHQRVKGKR